MILTKDGFFSLFSCYAILIRQNTQLADDKILKIFSESLYSITSSIFAYYEVQKPLLGPFLEARRYLTAFERIILLLLYQEIKRFSGPFGEGFLKFHIYCTKSV